MSASPFWPCPNGCMNWARMFRPGEPMTNHHPNCSHVNDSLIDVWRVRSSCGSIIVDAEPLPEELPEDAKIEKIKMHREIYEATPEFTGW